MENSRSTELRVGVVTILALVLLIVGITVGRGINVSVNTTSLTFRFPSSRGLEAQSLVTVNGVKRGIVTSVKNDGSSVLVTADVNDIGDLRSDASGRIMILEITGGKKIEIDPGRESSGLNSANVIQGEAVPDFGEMMAVIGEVSGDAKNLIRRLDTLTGSANKLLADTMTIHHIKKTFANADLALAELHSILLANRGKFNTTMDNLTVMSGDARTLIAENKSKFNSIIDNTDNLTMNAKSTMVKLDESLARINRFVDSTQSMLNDIKRGNGSISRLLYDPQLANNLDSAVGALKVFSKSVNEHGVNVNLRLGTRP